MVINRPPGIYLFEFFLSKKFEFAGISVQSLIVNYLVKIQNLLVRTSR